MEKFWSQDFWSAAFDSITAWMVKDFPGLLIIVVLYFIVIKVISVFMAKLKKNLINRTEKGDAPHKDESIKRINTLTDIIHKTASIALLLVFLMLLLQKFGINIGPILASVGVLGLAIGFGAQELVKDFISGFFILLENQVRTGDVAIINGTGGLVEQIELRTITLRDFSGTVHVIQNGKINTLSNMTKDWSAMVFDIGVAYKEDTQKVMDVMKEVGDELANDPDFESDIIEPMEVFGLDQFGDSAIVIKARIKTKPIKQWSVGREYRKRLKYAFDQQGIEIPFPHTTLYWGEEIKPLDLKLANLPDTLKQ
ncbi:MAG: mechanosensitive ion channel family protein [Bacteroidales bacterium]